MFPSLQTLKNVHIAEKQLNGVVNSWQRQKQTFDRHDLSPSPVPQRIGGHVNKKKPRVPVRSSTSFEVRPMETLDAHALPLLQSRTENHQAAHSHGAKDDSSLDKSAFAVLSSWKDGQTAIAEDSVLAYVESEEGNAFFQSPATEVAGVEVDTDEPFPEPSTSPGVQFTDLYAESPANSTPVGRQLVNRSPMKSNACLASAASPTSVPLSLLEKRSVSMDSAGSPPMNVASLAGHIDSGEYDNQPWHDISHRRDGGKTDGVVSPDDVPQFESVRELIAYLRMNHDALGLESVSSLLQEAHSKPIPPTRVPPKFSTRDDNYPLMHIIAKWGRMVSPSAAATSAPASRVEVLLLARAYKMMLKDMSSAMEEIIGNSSIDRTEILRRELDTRRVIDDVVFSEVIRQVWLQCAERGLLLSRVKESYDSHFRTFELALEASASAYKSKVELLQQTVKQEAAERVRLEKRVEILSKLLVDVKKECIQKDNVISELREQVASLTHRLGNFLEDEPVMADAVTQMSPRLSRYASASVLSVAVEAVQSATDSDGRFLSELSRLSSEVDDLAVRFVPFESKSWPALSVWRQDELNATLEMTKRVKRCAQAVFVADESYSSFSALAAAVSHRIKVIMKEVPSVEELVNAKSEYDDMLREVATRRQEMQQTLDMVQDVVLAAQQGLVEERHDWLSQIDGIKRALVGAVEEIKQEETLQRKDPSHGQVRWAAHENDRSGVDNSSSHLDNSSSSTASAVVDGDRKSVEPDEDDGDMALRGVSKVEQMVQELDYLFNRVHQWGEPASGSSPKAANLSVRDPGNAVSSSDSSPLADDPLQAIAEQISVTSNALRETEQSLIPDGRARYHSKVLSTAGMIQVISTATQTDDVAASASDGGRDGERKSSRKLKDRDTEKSTTQRASARSPATLVQLRSSSSIGAQDMPQQTRNMNKGKSNNAGSVAANVVLEISQLSKQIRNARLALVREKYRGCPPKSVLWALKLVHSIFREKVSVDAISKEYVPMPAFVFEYMRQQYGTHLLVEQYVGHLVATVAVHRNAEAYIQIFAEFLEERWCSRSWTIFCLARKYCDDSHAGIVLNSAVADASKTRGAIVKVVSLRRVLSVLDSLLPAVSEVVDRAEECLQNAGFQCVHRAKLSPLSSEDVSRAVHAKYSSSNGALAIAANSQESAADLMRKEEADECNGFSLSVPEFLLFLMESLQEALMPSAHVNDV